MKLKIKKYIYMQKKKTIESFFIGCSFRLHCFVIDILLCENGKHDRRRSNDFELLYSSNDRNNI